MIAPILATLLIAQPATITMVAPVSDTGAWRLYSGEYWQTWQGRRMNQPRVEIVTGGKQPASLTIEGGYQVKRVAPIINPQPVIGGDYSWGRFEAVDGLRIIGATVRFSRQANQGSGFNFRWCKNIRIERTTFILESDLPVTTGGTGYGVVFSGCENVTLVNCRFVKCHAGAMFTDGTTEFAVFDSVLDSSWMLSTHGGSVNRGLFCRLSRVGEYGRLHIGNITLPDGASQISVIDCDLSALEFSGKIDTAKVQGGRFDEVLFNQYRARSGDAQADYSQTNIEIDGTTKVGRVVVKAL